MMIKLLYVIFVGACVVRCCVVIMVYMCVCCIQYVLKHYRIDNFLLKFFVHSCIYPYLQNDNVIIRW